MGDGPHRPVRLHRLDRRGIEQPDLAGERRKGGGEEIRHAREALEIGGSAVDPGPGFDLAQHRRSRGDAEHRRLVS